MKQLSKVVLSIHSTLVKVEKMGVRTINASDGWTITLEDAGHVRAVKGADRYLFSPAAWLEAVESETVQQKGKR